MSAETAIALLIASNISTLALLAFALRANWRWRKALSELGDRTRRDIRQGRAQGEPGNTVTRK